MTEKEWWIIFGLLAVAFILGWRFLAVRKRLRIRESELAALDAEEHRMFDFLHHLGESIEQERSLAHLYKTIVEGIEEVVAADGVALYLLDGDELSPGHLSKRCPALITVPKEMKSEGDAEIRKWLRLGRVKREGEFLSYVAEHPSGVRWSQGGREMPEGVSHFFGVPLSHAGKVFAVLSAVRKEGSFSNNDWDVFRSAAEQSAFGLGNALLHKEVQEKRRMDDELRTAQEVQKILLPSKTPDWPGYRVRGTNSAARLISGDYFDFVNLPEERHGVVIADVSGKGVAAGLVMASCRSALRAHAVVAEGPAETLKALNAQVFIDMREDMFVSAAYAVLENGSGKVTLARAGHDAPLLFRKSTGQVEKLKPGGLALGIDKGPVFERVLKEMVVKLESGDVILFYTDGVNEAENGKGQEFGKERLLERFAKLALDGAEGVVTELPKELNDFADGSPQIDDITLVAIERI
ncbi:MAG: SpoIIE family protein phosphatase [Roseibacillus sp.]